MNTRRIAAAIFVVFAVVVSGTGSAAPAFSSQNSPQTRARVVVRRTDVIYGRVQGSALLADLAFPEGDDVKPAILYVFGGRWRSGSRVNNQGNWERLAKLAESGFFTMTIDHRLVGGSPAPAPYEDTLCAIRWLHAHAGEYGVDENRIFLICNSSGGHLVALAATLGDGPFARAGGWDAFTRIDQDTVACTLREDGKVSATGTTTVSKDGKALTVTTRNVSAAGPGNTEIYDRID